MWNLEKPKFLRVGTYVEPWGTWILERNLYVEPWRTWTFKSGTFMWNLGEPGARFRAAAPNHPEAYWKSPKLFKLLGVNKNKPVWKPQQPRWTWNTSKPLQKRSPLSKVKKLQNIKRKVHLEPLSGALKTSGGTYKFQTFTSKYRTFFSETFETLCSTCIWNLYVEPFSLDVEPWSETFTWNLYTEILMWSFYPQPSWQTFLRNVYVEPLCQT